MLRGEGLEDLSAQRLIDDTLVKSRQTHPIIICSWHPSLAKTHTFRVSRRLKILTSIPGWRPRWPRSTHPLGRRWGLFAEVSSQRTAHECSIALGLIHRFDKGRSGSPASPSAKFKGLRLSGSLPSRLLKVAPLRQNHGDIMTARVSRPLKVVLVLHFGTLARPLRCRRHPRTSSHEPATIRRIMPLRLDEYPPIRLDQAVKRSNQRDGLIRDRLRGDIVAGALSEPTLHAEEMGSSTYRCRHKSLASFGIDKRASERAGPKCMTPGQH